MTDQPTFSFGRNWLEFLSSIDEERIGLAAESLTSFLGMPSLKGKTFLDVGCGSGLFSLAAFHLGAEHIVSFDVDPFSVECCRHLHKVAGHPPHWEILAGSVLDESFLESLGYFDIVYSWGVLHHTGRMWNALEYTARRVGAGGHLYLALYNKIVTRSGNVSWIHPFWLKVKSLYNHHPFVGEYIILPIALAAYLAIVLVQFKNPLKHIKNYRSARGMSWITDAKDWLGGLPYEFATVEEVFLFLKTRFPDFNLVNIKTTGGRGLNWYLFQRSGVPVLADHWLHATTAPQSRIDT